MILKGLYKSKLQDSVQFQIVLAVYEQENIRNSGQLNCSTRVKTALRRPIDQVMRTRNFRARNEVLETGKATKSHKEKQANAERSEGECCQWKANRQFSTCSYRQEPASGNRCAGERKEQSFSPASNGSGRRE